MNLRRLAFTIIIVCHFFSNEAFCQPTYFTVNGRQLEKPYPWWPTYTIQNVGGQIKFNRSGTAMAFEGNFSHNPGHLMQGLIYGEKTNNGEWTFRLAPVPEGSNIVGISERSPLTGKFVYAVNLPPDSSRAVSFQGGSNSYTAMQTPYAGASGATNFTTFAGTINENGVIAGRVTFEESCSPGSTDLMARSFAIKWNADGSIIEIAGLSFPLPDGTPPYYTDCALPGFMGTSILSSSPDGHFDLVGLGPVDQVAFLQFTEVRSLAVRQDGVIVQQRSFDSYGLSGSFSPIFSQSNSGIRILNDGSFVIQVTNYNQEKRLLYVDNQGPPVILPINTEWGTDCYLTNYSKIGEIKAISLECANASKLLLFDPIARTFFVQNPNRIFHGIFDNTFLNIASFWIPFSARSSLGIMKVRN